MMGGVQKTANIICVWPIRDNIDNVQRESTVLQQPQQPKAVARRVLNEGVTSFAPTSKAPQQEDLLFIE